MKLNPKIALERAHAFAAGYLYGQKNVGKIYKVPPPIISPAHRDEALNAINQGFIPVEKDLE